MIISYTKILERKYDENMQPVGEPEEVVITHLKADEGKRIKQKSTGITGTAVDVAPPDTAENYEEVDDTNYTGA